MHDPPPFADIAHVINETHLVQVNAYLLPKYRINDADHAVQHDILPFSSVELLIVPEDGRYWTLGRDVVRKSRLLLREVTHQGLLARWSPAGCSRTRLYVALVSQ